MEQSLVKEESQSEFPKGKGGSGDFVSIDMPLDVEEREQLVTTASKFLLNPRVRSTSIQQKLQFLRQKGLTEAEISTACRRAGIDVGYEQKLAGQFHGASGVASNQLQVQSLWTKAKDIANLVALFSIGSYSLYCLWKQYLEPRLFGTRSRHEENYQQLLVSITKLNENVTELKELIRTIQESQTLYALQGTNPASGNSNELKEIRNELSAIKSLLLGRQQFPTSPSSGIPSWQMIEAEGYDDDEASNGKEPTKSKRKERKAQRKQDQSSSGDEMKTGDPEGETSASCSSSMSIIRKRPSGEGDSNHGGLTSGSSCEVVYVGEKHDSSNSDPNSNSE